MAELNPPGFLQNRTDHSARILRKSIGVFIESEGIVTDTDWLVSERAAGVAMSVDIAVGQAYIEGTEATNQGFYYCLSEAVVNKTIAASHASLNRIDIVIARVYDAFYSGASSLWTFEVVTGTPHASPVAPALPDNSLLLATIAVDATVTTIVDADITDGRTVMVPRGGGGVTWAVISGGTTTTYSDSGTDYEVHSYLSTSALDVLTAGLVDVLLVGGGGGGGSTSTNATGGWSTTAGGGGGGGVIRRQLYLEPGSYTVAIGAGGAGGVVSAGLESVAGSPTYIGAGVDLLVAVGGGCGGSYTYLGPQGANTGGAGGHDYGGNATGTVNVSITGTGYVGGTKAATGGGGGGGAGGNGSNGASTAGGAGGPGYSSTLRTGSAVFYGGGGGGGGSASGGAAGSGGGGAGVTTGTPNNGTANTGGGGGGHYRTNTGAAGANGGSGIAVFRTIVATSVASGIIMSGGTETTFTGDGTNGVNGADYKVHTFNSTASLTVTAFPLAASCDLLLVGGGGSGGGVANGYSGGGGAGGVKYISGVRLPVGSLTATIGAGGTVGASNNIGGVGGATSLGSLFSVAGGGGGNSWNGNQVAGNGASGGGGSGSTGSAGTGKTVDSTVGNNGGQGVSSAGGGGGGAGAAGTNSGGANQPGAGGVGVASLITGTSTYYGGGGGGGGNAGGSGLAAGGNGGGGRGEYGADGLQAAGTANTGGGGGGRNNSGTVAGANGGSGVIIIRYMI